MLISIHLIIILDDILRDKYLIIMDLVIQEYVGCQTTIIQQYNPFFFNLKCLLDKEW